jgi:hypothetical protein
LDDLFCFFSRRPQQQQSVEEKKKPDTQKNWAIINLSIAVGVFLSPEFSFRIISRQSRTKLNFETGQ